MSHPWLLEAALRSLLMGATIFAVLKVLRIRQVRAQRTAWVLALLAAIVMPALMHWPVGPQLVQARVLRALSSPALIRDAATGEPSLGAIVKRRTGLSRNRANAASQLDAASFSDERMMSDALPVSTIRMMRSQPTRPAISHRIGTFLKAGLAAAMPFATAVYVCVAFLFLVRLMTGVALTLRLRQQSVQAPWYYEASSFGATGSGAAGRAEDIRISARLHTPATIASSIVLPEASADWDPAKLRMVLAHERAHVQQADFYVHILAGLHCAIFWFSPFSWWLQRRLSALGEAMSDLAALQQAESRSSYAEVLLEFATAAHQPMAAISMARSSNLRPRIERLLNDQLFRDAFSVKRRHPFLAASIVPIALLASASLVRVHAAVQTPSPAPVAAVAPVPAAIAADPAAPAPVAEPVPKAGPAVQPTTHPVVHPDPIPLGMEQMQLDIDSRIKVDQAIKLAMNSTKLQVQVERANMLISRADMAEQIEKATRNSYDYSYGDRDGDSFALVLGDGDVNFTGRYDDHFKDIRGKMKGEFIYYEHDGKSYVIQDPALLARVKAMYAPMSALGKQQEELGRRQEALGKRQEELGHQQEAVKIPVPDLSKELASLDKAMQELKALQSSKDVTQESLGDVQTQIGEIQGRLGELQGKGGEEMSKFGDQMGVLGAEQGKLGAEQGRLGEQQGKLAEEAQRTMKPLLQEAIKDGRAKPVD